MAAKKRVNRHRPAAKKTGAQTRGSTASEQAKGHSLRIESLMKVIAFLGIFGFILSLYLVWLHYKPTGGSFCSISETFDCIAVAQSGHSSILGVPVAMIGMIGYLAFTVIALFLIFRDVRRYPTLNVKLLNRIMLAMAIIGFAFSIYLALVQELVLKVWCILCIASGLTITGILVLAILSQTYCLRCRKNLRNMGVEPAKVCRYC